MDVPVSAMVYCSAAVKSVAATAGPPMANAPRLKPQYPFVLFTGATNQISWCSKAAVHRNDDLLYAISPVYLVWSMKPKSKSPG